MCNDTEPARPSVTLAWTVAGLLFVLATTLLILNGIGWDAS